MDLLSEAVELAKQIRQYGADVFGPWVPLLTLIAQSAAAAVAAIALVAGKSFWTPPTPTRAGFPVRIGGFGALAGIGLLIWRSKSGGTAFEFGIIGVVAIVTAFLAAIVYLALRLTLCFQCQSEKTLFVRGFRLDPEARGVLALRKLSSSDLPNAIAQLPPQRHPPVQDGKPILPQSDTDYFCKANRDEPLYIWTRWSIVLAQVLLFIGYVVFIIPLAIAVAGVSMAVSQPQLEEKQVGKEHRLDLPADVLFEFGSAQIRPGAITSLEEAASILVKEGIHQARIQGHTDSRGPPAYNLDLSRRRAAAVETWLHNRDGLNDVRFSIEAYGASRPIAPNEKPDGSDDPEGRAKNRRVVIAFDRD